eukprot:1445435-Prymnesium_polylepis.1
MVRQPLWGRAAARLASVLDGDGGRCGGPRGGHVARHLQQRPARPVVVAVGHGKHIRLPDRHQHRRRVGSAAPRATLPPAPPATKARTYCHQNQHAAH